MNKNKKENGDIEKLIDLLRWDDEAPIPTKKEKEMMSPDPRDPSEWGGESAEPDEMNPGPQPAPEEDQTPAEDDPSKDGSGGA